MKKLLLLFLITHLFSAFAQKATIKGILTDSKTSEALIGVNVSTEDSTVGSITDTDGKYELSVSPGKHQLTFSYVGYDNIVKEVSVKENQVLSLDVRMGEAQSLLDEVVVTSSKFERKIGEESVSIDIIKPAAMEKQNINSVDQALQRSSGVTVVDGQANIRGGSGYSYGAGSRVLLLLDDLPILQADAGFPSWSGLPVENIGQVEIIKGAASALYGTSAMNGIVNIRTAYPTSKPYAKVSVFGSVSDNPNEKDYTYDPTTKSITGKANVDKRWWNLDSITLLAGANGIFGKDTTIKNPYTQRPYDAGFSLGYRQKIGKVDVVAGGMFYKRMGTNWGSRETRARTTLDLGYHINNKAIIGLNTNIMANNSQTFFLWGGDGVAKYLPSSVTGMPTESRSFRMSLDPYFRYTDDKGNSHKVLGRYVRTAIDNTNNQDNSNDYYYGEYQYQRRIDKINFVVTGGAVSSYVRSTAQLFGDTIHTSTNIGGYFQVDKKFWNRLNISYGFRFEANKIDKEKWEVKPVSRVGLNVQAAKYTFIRASFGQGYRYPTIAEKFTQTELGTGFMIYPNRDLVSETGLSAELGIKQGIKLGKYVNAFADVAGFYTQYSNMIEFNLVTSPGFGFKANNVGDTRIYGLEASVGGEGKLFGKFPTTLNLGYTYIVPQYRHYDRAKTDYLDIATYNVLKYRIRHQFVGVWDVDFKGFTFGVTGQYYSFMENVDAIFTTILPSLDAYRASHLKKGSSLTDAHPKFKGDFVLDVRVGYHFMVDNRDMTFSFLVKNITNREYTLRPALVEAPRSFGFRIDMAFN